MKEHSALVFDTETTGLTLHPDVDVSKQPRIIEFGAMILDTRNGYITEEINLMIDPGVPIPAEITKITGITQEMVTGAPGFLTALPQIRRAFASCRTVVAHNLPFDKTIMMGELKRNGLTHFVWPENEFCTMGAYREQWGKSPRLVELYERYMGKPLAQTHRALDDVRALVEIIQVEQLWTMM